ncbi:hypothetical protein MMA231_02007 [Asticcacaulis sp. MM231]|uniref:DUF2842 domain-containing protein n=1 Tax=Asticcacaulis sp. MM231 TaxID=3157666 RepID=UPI0032D576BC
MEHEPVKGLRLPQRRLIACIGIVVFLAVYVVIVTAIAGFLHGGKITALVFFALAGTLWGLPIIPLISWSENYKKKKKK